MGSRFSVYILAGPLGPRPVLYTGVTSDLLHRLAQHRQAPSGFVRRYNIRRLVYYEWTTSIHDAIAREKQIKGWSRAKKIALIKHANPYWRDLYPEQSRTRAREPG
ncbi:MAG: GIY-YIG nuclease family protein [Polyangiaceae bacterium]